MDSMYQRTEMLIGSKALNKLKASKVLVFGCGGVGSYIIEALTRAGIGSITIVDSDEVAESNINRQIIATTNTIGMAKVNATKDRILSINPTCNVTTFNCFVSKDNIDTFEIEKYDYVADAIDTVSAKIAIIEKCKEYNVPIISSMGTGNKMDPTRFKISDIEKTSICPLARVMRRELKNRNIKNVKVLWSDEEPYKNNNIDSETGKPIPASISFVPSSAGLIIAGEIIKDLIK